MDGLIKNSDHKAFKEPLPKYNQGESLKTNTNLGTKNHDAKINYTYANTDNLIAMLEPICESVNMTRPRYDDYGTSDERPKFILRGVDSVEHKILLNMNP